MRLFYNLLIFKASVILQILSLFNTKIKKGVEGRKSSFLKIEKHINSTDKTIWFHCSSLGEYEQGLPVFEEIRSHYPDHKIVLSFFSPSGYEIRKNSTIADVVIYLPLDSNKNAKRFVDFLKPELTVFVKYDIWPNYINQLEKHGLKKVLISAALRPNQIYFKWYGGLFRDALTCFEYIFTQNEETKLLLKNIDYKTAIVSGDTRFDRVSNQINTNNRLDFIESFKAKKTTIVFGSSWQEDEAIFIDFINNADDNLKFIIAPHEINETNTSRLLNIINKETILFSHKDSNEDLSNYNVFIIDTIGLLSKIYSYADIAYVGGAMGKTGLHNILEPATFGIPVLFGNNHKKFPEAENLINYGGAVEVSTKDKLNETIHLLLSNTNFYENKSQASKEFITNQKGATKLITEHLFNN